MRGRTTTLVAGLVVLGLAAGGMATAAEADQETSEVTASVSFTDIGPGDVFYDDVLWMAESGITTGWPDGTFRPTAPVTREAMAAFLYRWVYGPLTETCDPEQERVFSDVTAGHPFCVAIEWLSEFAVHGYPDGTFRPGLNLTREAFAAILMRGFSADAACDPTTARVFTDVPLSHPFCGYIEAAAERGFVTGWPDGTFRPGLNIERQAFAAMLHRVGDIRATGLAATWAADAA